MTTTALQEVAEKLRRAGAAIPAPEHKGTIESAIQTGLSIALVLVEDAAAALSQQAAPAGYVLMPAELTAENGAKGALLGEFAERIWVTCPECEGEDSDCCDVCDASGEVPQQVPVKWDTIKAIYRKAVQAFAISPDTQQAEQDRRDAARYRWLRNPDTNVALVLDKRTGWVPPDDAVPGVGGYHTYEYRAGDELDAAIDAARADQGAA